MTTSTTQDVSAIPRIQHVEAMAIAATENRKFADQASVRESDPAGGSSVQGTGGETHSLDAIEFSRIVAERADGDGVLRHKLPL